MATGYNVPWETLIAVGVFAINSRQADEEAKRTAAQRS